MCGPRRRERRNCCVVTVEVGLTLVQVAARSLPRSLVVQRLGRSSATNSVGGLACPASGTARKEPSSPAADKWKILQGCDALKEKIPNNIFFFNFYKIFIKDLYYISITSILFFYLLRFLNDSFVGRFAGQEHVGDVGEDAALRKGHAGQQPVELLVVAHGQHDVAGDDALLLVVLGGVARQLQNFGREILQDGGQVDGGAGAAGTPVAAGLHGFLEAEHGELQAGLGGQGPRIGGRHFSSLASTGHRRFVVVIYQLVLHN